MKFFNFCILQLALAICANTTLKADILTQSISCTNEYGMKISFNPKGNETEVYLDINYEHLKSNPDYVDKLSALKTHLYNFRDLNTYALTPYLGNVEKKLTVYLERISDTYIYIYGLQNGSLSTVTVVYDNFSVPFVSLFKDCELN